MIKFIKQLLPSYTKWIPLGEFCYGDVQYIVMARGNRKTGELFFKTKSINKNLFRYCHPIGKLPIDITDQWNILISEVNFVETDMHAEAIKLMKRKIS